MNRVELNTKNVLLIGDTYEAASREAARNVVDDLKACIAEKGQVVWQVSSGGTPKRMYEIITDELAQEVDWQKVTLVQMDEYLDVQLTDKASQYFFVNENLVSKLSFKNVISFDADVIENPGLFEEHLNAHGGIDIAIHGIGVNGHLAFNEPGSELESRTRKVVLAESTRVANSRFFDSLDQVPTHGITVGLETIMEARKVYLLAFGEAKKDAIFGAIAGPATLDNPATIFQSHKNAVYILDQESAELVNL